MSSIFQGFWPIFPVTFPLGQVGSTFGPYYSKTILPVNKKISVLQQKMVFLAKDYGMEQAAEFYSIIKRGDRASLPLKTVMTRVDRLKAEDC
jgi:hypothetical protein